MAPNVIMNKIRFMLALEAILGNARGAPGDTRDSLGFPGGAPGGLLLLKTTPGPRDHPPSFPPFPPLPPPSPHHPRVSKRRRNVVWVAYTEGMDL